MDDFYTTLPAFDDFDKVADDNIYHPLPDDWVLGISDIVQSTKAISEGRYKAVNMAGASAISAVMNGCSDITFPFIFGGDGAGMAVPASHAGKMCTALSQAATWVGEELDLVMRVASVPMTDLRANGHEVTVARFSPSPDVRYAMFSGGGMQWAERQMKQGQFAIPPASPGTRPNLEGLSCRWAPIGSQNGSILSLVVLAGPAAAPASFTAALHEILRCLENQPDALKPMPGNGPDFGWPPEGLDIEARAMAPAGRRWLAKLQILAQMAIAALADGTRWRPGGIDLAHYRRTLSRNADFRKFDDGLHMTVDVGPALEAHLMTILKAQQESGTIRYGLHRQDQAIMTCIVPSVLDDNHMHFVDGAGGGYAQAAAALKQDDA